MLRIIYLVMIAVMGVSSRSIGQVRPSTSDHPIAPLPALPILSKTLDSCTFRPQPSAAKSPLSQRPSPLGAAPIPRTAWPNISRLLAAYLTNPHTLHPSKENSMQSLNLGHLLNDATLEGVVLGIVHSTDEEGDERGELRIREEDRDLRTECVARAAEEVEKMRLMEGIMDVEGSGRVSFLVYRVD